MLKSDVWPRNLANVSDESDACMAQSSFVTPEIIRFDLCPTNVTLSLFGNESGIPRWHHPLILIKSVS